MMPLDLMVTHTFAEMDFLANHGLIGSRLRRRWGDDEFEAMRERSVEHYLNKYLGEERTIRVRDWLREKLKDRGKIRHFTYKILKDIVESPGYQLGIDTVSNNLFSYAIMMPTELFYLGMSVPEHLGTRLAGVPINTMEGPIYRRVRDYFFNKFGIKKKETALLRKIAKYGIETGVGIVIGMPSYYLMMLSGGLVDLALGGEGPTFDKFVRGTISTMAVCFLTFSPRSKFMDFSYQQCDFPIGYDQDQPTTLE